MVVGKKHNQLNRWLNCSPQSETTSSAQNSQSWSVRGLDREGNRDIPVSRPVRELVKGSLDHMSNEERKILYNHWVRERIAELNDELLNSVDDYNLNKTTLDRCKQGVHLRCLLQAHVIGITTSGLAKNLEVLRKVRSKVAICEEAGKVLGAHILYGISALRGIRHSYWRP